MSNQIPEGRKSTGWDALGLRSLALLGHPQGCYSIHPVSVLMLDLLTGCVFVSHSQKSSRDRLLCRVRLNIPKLPLAWNAPSFVSEDYHLVEILGANPKISDLWCWVPLHPNLLTFWRSVLQTFSPQQQGKLDLNQNSTTKKS